MGMWNMNSGSKPNNESATAGLDNSQVIRVPWKSYILSDRSTGRTQKHKVKKGTYVILPRALRIRPRYILLKTTPKKNWKMREGSGRV